MAVMMENTVVNTDDLSDFDEKGSQSSDNEHGTNVSNCSIALFSFTQEYLASISEFFPNIVKNIDF